MTFTPIHSKTLSPYRKAPSPATWNDPKVYYDNELRKLELTINTLVLVIEEMREYLKTLP